MPETPAAGAPAPRRAARGASRGSQGRSALPRIVTCPLPEPVPLPLTPETFAAVVELVADRTRDPEAARRIAEDANLKDAVERYHGCATELVQAFNRNERYFAAQPHKFLREPQIRSPKYAAQQSRVRHTPPAPKADTLSLPLAVALGELRRLARLDAEALAAERIAGVELLPSIAARFEGDATFTFAIAPVLVFLGDQIFGPRVDVATDCQGRPAPEVPLGLVAEAVVNLGTLQDLLCPADKSLRVAAAYHIGRNRTPTLARELTAAHVLAAPTLADALQVGYDQHWHTHPKTRKPTAAWVAAVRERAIRQATPELLTVMAASSDGQCRGAAGISANTPERVYKAMLGDNSLGVLEQVVQSPKFGQEEAYALLKTDLPNQIVAVMRYSRVDMAIRVLACERAIQHPKVDPNHVLRFLIDQRGREDVPESLWHTLILTMKHKLQWIREHGDAKQAEVFEDYVSRFTKAFIADILRPYWEHKKLVKRNPDGPRRYGADARAYHTAVQFLRSTEFIKDGDLLNILLEGKLAAKDLLELMKNCREAEIPLTTDMMLAVIMHEDPEVRAEAPALMPNVREEDVPRMAAEVKARIAQEIAAVRDEVETIVIPEFDEEEFVLTARRVSANHHYFVAAREVDLETLEAAFVSCARKDPRTIPDEFRRMIAARHYQEEVDEVRASEVGDGTVADQAAADAVAARGEQAHGAVRRASSLARAVEAIEASAARPEDTVPLTALDGMVQGDLFGAGTPAPERSASALPPSRRPGALT